MREGPEPQPGVLDILPYVGGEGTLTGHALASNENPLGAGAAARAAILEGLGRLHVYPDGGANALREAIAEVHGLDPARIVCGNGSDELLALLCRAYAGAGCEVIHSEHGFLMYRISALAAGAVPVAVSERNLRADVDALLAAVSNRTRILFLANPNNPTGSVLDRGELCRLLEGLPGRVLLVLDSAYAEYAEGLEYEDGASLVENHPNVVMTRTFSKIHGLAALRVGWAYCPEPVASVLNRVRGPFNCNAPGMFAAAAAIRDRTHVERSVAMNSANRAALGAGLQELGIEVAPSAGNFVLARFGSSDLAGQADSALRDAGIRVRRMAAYGLPESLRITVGTEAAVRDVLGALAGSEVACGAGGTGPMFERVAILGLGLIGSSLARALRAKALARTITGHSRSARTRAAVAELGLCDSVFATSREAVRGASLVVLCTPVGAFRGLAAEIQPVLEEGAIVTDVGGVKSSVIEELAPLIPPQCHFVPGHPIAGTENSGPESGFDSLFEQRWCILTPPPGTDREAVQRVRALWEAVGSRVTEMTPAHHDRALSIISHLPHVLAYVMVGVAADVETVAEREVIRYSASGFRDFTRIAASDPEMWRDIFLANREAILEGMSRFAEEMFTLQRAIRWGDGERLVESFRRGQEIRKQIVDAGQDAEGSALYMTRRGQPPEDDGQKSPE